MFHWLKAFFEGDAKTRAVPTWIQYSEPLAGENSPTYSDVLNRAVKEFWANFLVGHDEDGNHTITFPAEADVDLNTTHRGRIDNPHSVTAAQVDAPTNADLSDHTGNVSNPHSVTAAQTGAATQTDFDTHAAGSSYWDHQKLANYISGTLHQPNKYTLANDFLNVLALVKAAGQPRLTGICHLIDGFTDTTGITGGNYTHDAVNFALDVPSGGQVVPLASISTVGGLGQHGVRVYVLADQTSFAININGSNYAQEESLQIEDGKTLKIWETSWLNVATCTIELLTFGSAVTYRGIQVSPLLAREV